MRRADRLFDIIQMLRTATGPLTASALAETLEVTVRTVYRDIATLQARRVPIDGAAGVGYVLRRGYDLPPLAFTADELEAITVGAEMLRRTGDTGLQAAARSVLSKVMTGASSAASRPKRDAFFVSAFGASPPRAADLALVRAAIRDRRKVKIRYRGSDGGITSRKLCPLAVAYYVQSTVVAGWCELRKDYRHFRADRIERLTILDETFDDLAGRPMALPFNEKLLMLVPPALYYRRRIENEIRSGEPELAMLRELMPNGSTAIDVGANQGFFAFALSEVADRVVSFEANPDYARFARWMLRGRAEVHEVAISDQPGRATFYVPLSDEGMVLHFAGNLKQTHSQFKNQKTYDVELRTLDSYGLDNVRFIKIDVEGSEREVLDGAKAIIARDRPGLLLELLSGTHADPYSYTEAICADFGYEAFVVQKGERLPGLPTIAALGKNTSWGSKIETRNVLFLPR